MTNSKRETNYGAEHNLFVAIMREEDDGNYSMVYETSTESVINTALAEAGKVLEKQTKTKPDAHVPEPVIGNVNSTKPKLTVMNKVVMSKGMGEFATQGIASPA